MIESFDKPPKCKWLGKIDRQVLVMLRCKAAHGLYYLFVYTKTRMKSQKTMFQIFLGHFPHSQSPIITVFTIYVPKINIEYGLSSILSFEKSKSLSFSTSDITPNRWRQTVSINAPNWLTPVKNNFH